MSKVTNDAVKELQHNCAVVATLPLSHPQFYDRLEQLENMIKCVKLQDYFDTLD